jgi:hypothetical protein
MTGRPDITAGLPERDPPTKCTQQTASGDTLPSLKEALVTLTLGWRPQTTWVFVTEITHEFILGLDVVHAHDAYMDLRYHVLQLGDKEVPLWHLGTRPHSTPCMKGNIDIATAQCDRVMAVRLEGPLKTVDSLKGTGSRTTTHAEQRTQVRPPR